MTATANARQPAGALPPNTPATRLRILISAYACEPGKGSEPGIGWNFVREAALRHDVWVITRANNRAAIDAEIERDPLPGLRPVYFDLPRWLRWWKRGQRGSQLYYYLWQLGMVIPALRLQRRIGFDVTHHVTFGRYWGPSVLPLLQPPFLWGPVGGGESAPAAFRPGFSWQGRLYERLRDFARWLGERDPLVRCAIRRNAIALATTRETRERLQALGVRRVAVFSAMGLGGRDHADLVRLPDAPTAPIRFVSIGRLLHWKGFHFGLEAFAAAAVPDAEFWVIGDGPEQRNLRELARELGIAEQVRFWGTLTRPETLARLSECHALVHPSLHDSGGWVCIEAMAAGRPVICLDLGGPGEQVTAATGFSVPAHDPEQVVWAIAEAMAILASDTDRRIRMGNAARERVASNYLWWRRGELLDEFFREVAARGDAKVEVR